MAEMMKEIDNPAVDNLALHLELLTPFGVVAKPKEQSADLRSISKSVLQEWIEEHRLAVLRGFAPLGDEELIEYCKSLGEILEWSFGYINELRADAQAKNYLYTNRAVPFHWDGAFVGRIPRYIFFDCRTAPPEASGGETLFCDAVRLLEQAAPAQREIWEKITVTYATEKIAHYGGVFSSPMIAKHPFSGKSVLRFAQPVEDLNPVRLDIDGIAEHEREEFLKDMNERLNDPGLCYSHKWENGDLLIADNHALLHGRKAFSEAAPRHLRRINIL